MITWYKKGDIVLSNYYFSDGKGAKIRPLLILSQIREDFLVVAISTQIDQWGMYDLLIEPTQGNWLLKTSIARLSKLSTYTGETFHKKIGEIDSASRTKIKDNMKRFVDTR